MTIIAAHAAIVASVVLWDVRAPVEPHLIPAIPVTHAPVEASAPEIQNQDIAVGPTMQQARARRRWRSAKSRRSRPSRSSLPPPQPQAEFALPPKEEKVEKAGLNP
jgi:protein TonB